MLTSVQQATTFAVNKLSKMHVTYCNIPPVDTATGDKFTAVQATSMAKAHAPNS